MCNIDPEPVDTQLVPMLQDSIKPFVDVGILPIQVWLALIEHVQVPTLRSAFLGGKFGPCWSAKHAFPVVRRGSPAFPLALSDDEPRLSFMAIATLLRGYEPRMLGRDVIGDYVKEDRHAMVVELFDRMLEFFQCPKKRVYVEIVGDIIPMIPLGGWIGWIQPYSVNPE